MRALAEVRDPWGLAIALAAGAVALALTVPWPIALAAALAVVCVRVLAGLMLSPETPIPSQPLPGAHASGPGGTLTPKELEVAQLIYEGLRNREIADRLVISERTVDNHVQHILTKLDFHNRGEIVRWWAERMMSTKK
jgi:DNA-binding NarL/FixJ family response regulator